MTLSTQVSAAIKTRKTSAPDGGAAQSDVALSILKTLANGTANGEADKAWRDDRTLASNTSEDLDLAGSLTDELGAAVVFAEVCAILIEADEDNTTNLTIGGATAEAQLFFAAAGDKAILKPGDFLLAYSKTGWAITATTADGLKVANASGAAANYSIHLIGRSA